MDRELPRLVCASRLSGNAVIRLEEGQICGIDRDPRSRAASRQRRAAPSPGVLVAVLAADEALGRYCQVAMAKMLCASVDPTLAPRVSGPATSAVGAEA